MTVGLNFEKGFLWNWAGEVADRIQRQKCSRVNSPLNLLYEMTVGLTFTFETVIVNSPLNLLYKMTSGLTFTFETVIVNLVFFEMLKSRLPPNLLWLFPLKMLPPRNPPHREFQIPWYLAVQIQIEILVSFEFVPRHLSFSIWCF